MSLATLPYNRYSIARYYPLFNVINSKLSCRSNKSLLICNVVGLSLCFLGTKIGFLCNYCKSKSFKMFTIL